MVLILIRMVPLPLHPVLEVEEVDRQEMGQPIEMEAMATQVMS